MHRDDLEKNTNDDEKKERKNQDRQTVLFDAKKLEVIHDGNDATTNEKIESSRVSLPCRAESTVDNLQIEVTSTHHCCRSRLNSTGEHLKRRNGITIRL